MKSLLKFTMQKEDAQSFEKHGMQKKSSEYGSVISKNMMQDFNLLYLVLDGGHQAYGVIIRPQFKLPDHLYFINIKNFKSLTSSF